MSAQILTLLKYGLLALLYLFFARVLYSVWSELRPTGKQTAMAGGNSAVSGGSVTTRSASKTSRTGRESTRSSRRGRSTKTTAAAVGELLIIEPEALAGYAYPLGNEITVGRALGCGVPIDDTFVSSLHARVFARGAGSYVIEDLGSTNGTWLNDSRIDGPTAMHVGDRLRFGATLLELR